MSDNAPQYNFAQIRTQIRKALAGSQPVQIEVKGPMSEKDLEEFRKVRDQIAREEMRDFARKRLRKILT